jgi:hypothetical protein
MIKGRVANITIGIELVKNMITGKMDPVNWMGIMILNFAFA